MKSLWINTDRPFFMTHKIGLFSHEMISPLTLQLLQCLEKKNEERSELKTKY